MTHLASLTFAAFIAAGAISGAQAFSPGLLEAEQVGVPHAMQHRSGRVVHDDCHGRTSGTAHPRCGTATGGPSGGLH